MSETSEGLEGIAVVGMACRFPGADSTARFWENLRQGVESIRHFTDEELQAMGVPPDVYRSPNYVKAAPLLANADMFDAAFFGYVPREASIIDPQHRVFLECAWSALEDAGYDAANYRGVIGVFAGAGPNYYGGGAPPLSGSDDVVATYQRELGNEKDYLATRVSYKLGLRGPSLTIQTACSTSLVACHVACQSLWTYQCDMALAGGSGINAAMKGGYFYQEGMIPSPDGHCRAFDAKARGTVVGQGAGVVVLKRLSDALADGDTIHAVIRGSAINNDGSLRVGFTAPGVDGQAEVVTLAQTLAGVSPEDITYVETHGTATPLGDPIEIKALTQAFRRATDKRGYCAIGSVKTNVGHLDAAAGVAGLIKTVLMLEHREIPPSLHFETPNPEIDFERSPFLVNTALREWKSPGAPRLAGVSSFGLGGTNAHMVLQEPPPAAAPGPSRAWQILPLSARSSAALDAATANLAACLKQCSGLNLADVACTLQAGRRAFEHRRTVVCRHLGEAVAALESLDAKRAPTAFCEPGHRPLAFMFSGQGSQYINMGLELYGAEPVFREQIDRCADLLQRDLQIDLRKIIHPSADSAEQAAGQLLQTSVTQPALFAIEYALARLWMSWGLRPQALVGHSIGEYVAACLADVFTPEDALKLVAARGRLMQQQPRGCMLAVTLPEPEVTALLTEELSLAVVNGSSLCVVSGNEKAIERLETALAEKRVVSRRLQTSHAFHSVMMEPVLAPFAELVRQAAPKPPRIPFVSNLTGTWITPEEAVDPGYWAKHLRHTVRFSDCVQELLKEPNRLLLEVGPGCTLSTLAGQHPSKKKGHVVLASTRHPKEQVSDLGFILNTLGALWRAGATVDWAAYHAGERRRRIPLPTYPFERKRYWIEPRRAAAGAATAPAATASDGEAVAGVSGGDGVATPANGALGARAELTSEYVAPQSDAEKRLADLWRDLLGVEQVGIDDNFFELGGHSLLAVTIVSKAEKLFGAHLPLASFIEAPTIRAFARLVGDQHPAISWSSLVPLNASGSRTPVFLMHSHGGNILEYYPLAHRLGKDQPLYALQARGLDGSPLGDLRIEEMASYYLREIRSVQPKGPYILGGFCFGGFLAVEAAHQLLAQGEQVPLVVMINSATTDYPKFLPETRRSRWLQTLGNRLALEFSGLANKPFRQKSAHLLARCRRFGDIARARTEALMDALPAACRGPFRSHSMVYHREQLAKVHDRAWTAYVPKPYAGRVLVLRASRQPPGACPDPLLGWGGLLCGEIQACEIRGFRQNMLDEPNVGSVAAALAEALEAVERKETEVRAS